jgi:8-amino-7-oxononanoate synthase
VSWRMWAEAECAGIRAAGEWRELRTFDGDGITGRLAAADAEVVSFASNDYLGLSTHPAVVSAAQDAAGRWGAGAGSARLIVGSRPVHAELEAALAAWKDCEAALLFPTGFAANLSVLSVVGVAGVTILSDELNHASIIDGCRLARARVQVYRHRDLDHLSALLAETTRAVVVTDTVFSMDGDVADVAALAETCARNRALLVIDEAHAVLGPDCDLQGVEVLRVGTLSKFLGSLGGFVAGSRPLVELLVNRARPFIFTTAPTPADAAAALTALRIFRSDVGAALRGRLRAHVDRLRPGHPSPIVPVVLGEEEAAVAAARALLAHGIHVPAIRPPTVPPGTSRLRVTLSAAHSDDQVTALLGALHEVHVAA